MPHLQEVETADNSAYKKDDFFDQLSCEALGMSAQAGACKAMLLHNLVRSSAAHCTKRYHKHVHRRKGNLCMCSCGWLADWRQKMLEQKKIDMETFGGLGGVRHHSFGRGRGGGRGGGTGVPTAGRGGPPPAGSHRPGGGAPTGRVSETTAMAEPPNITTPEVSTNVQIMFDMGAF
jgi:hypothetical protein